MAYKLKDPAAPTQTIVPDRTDWQLEAQKLEAKLRELQKRFDDREISRVGLINKLIRENDKLKLQLKEKK